MGGPAAYAVSLYAISGDDIGAPRRVNHIDTDTSTVTPVFDLGTGNLGFFGLTLVDDRFYTVANDSNGNSSLHSFVLADGGVTTNVQSLGQGFNGGIVATASNQLYALATAFGGGSSLYSIDPAGAGPVLVDPALPFGLARGLTSDLAAQLLYATGSDFQFQRSLVTIDPSVPSTPATLGPLGIGVTGGVDLEPGGDFYAISNVTGASNLVSVAADGTITPEFSLSPFPAFDFGALTGGPAFTPPPPTPTPEPAGLWLLGPAALMLVRRSKTRRP